MSEIKIISGEIHNDERGILSSLNAFDFEGVERFYFIRHPDKSVIRGWHGHQFEKKWFYCVQGAFTLAFVKPDNWENASPDLVPEIFRLEASESKILCLPQGYANCIKALENNSILLVLSGKKMPECLEDSWRWEPQTWDGDKL